MNAADVRCGLLYRVARFPLLGLPAATVRVVGRETPETFLVSYPGPWGATVGGIAAADLSPLDPDNASMSP